MVTALKWVPGEANLVLQTSEDLKMRIWSRCGGDRADAPRLTIIVSHACSFVFRDRLCFCVAVWTPRSSRISRSLSIFRSTSTCRTTGATCLPRSTALTATVARSHCGTGDRRASCTRCRVTSRCVCVAFMAVFSSCAFRLIRVSLHFSILRRPTRAACCRAAPTGGCLAPRAPRTARCACGTSRRAPARPRCRSPAARR